MLQIQAAPKKAYKFPQIPRVGMCCVFGGPMYVLEKRFHQPIFQRTSTNCALKKTGFGEIHFYYTPVKPNFEDKYRPTSKNMNSPS